MSQQVVISGKPVHGIPGATIGSAANHIDENVNSKFFQLAWLAEW